MERSGDGKRNGHWRIVVVVVVDVAAIDYLLRCEDSIGLSSTDSDSSEANDDVLCYARTLRASIRAMFK